MKHIAVSPDRIAFIDPFRNHLQKLPAAEIHLYFVTAPFFHTVFVFLQTAAVMHVNQQNFSGFPLQYSHNIGHHQPFHAILLRIIVQALVLLFRHHFFAGIGLYKNILSARLLDQFPHPGKRKPGRKENLFRPIIQYRSAVISNDIPASGLIQTILFHQISGARFRPSGRDDHIMSGFRCGLDSRQIIFRNLVLIIQGRPVHIQKKHFFFCHIFYSSIGSAGTNTRSCIDSS